MNKDTRFLEAIKQCEDNMRYAVEHNQVLELEIWKKYKEQLETIGIVLGIIEI